MFDDNFYVRFDDKDKTYVLYVNGSPVYGKDIVKKIEEHYTNKEPLDKINEFTKDLDDAFREYCKVCHIPLVYDSFSDSMKSYLEHRDICDRKFLCEYQRMTRKQIFYEFNNADIVLLYEVACVLCSDKNLIKDEHDEEIFE